MIESPAAGRILIVDDEELARRGLEIRLQKFDDVEICGECRNGREAIDAVRATPPDIVFLDIQMPGKDGFQFIEQIQGMDRRTADRRSGRTRPG